jgi:hypothetical protein
MYAEDMNYWKTSKSNESTWLDRAIKQIDDIGGKVYVKAHGRDPKTGAAALMLQFQIGDDYFKIVWPILESKGENRKAATVQAATLMFHDIKARCMSAKILGARTAFFAYYMLPDGRSASEVGHEHVAQLFDTMSGRKQLGEGE